MWPRRQGPLLSPRLRCRIDITAPPCVLARRPGPPHRRMSPPRARPHMRPRPRSWVRTRGSPAPGAGRRCRSRMTRGFLLSRRDRQPHGRPESPGELPKLAGRLPPRPAPLEVWLRWRAWKCRRPRTAASSLRQVERPARSGRGVGWTRGRLRMAATASRYGREPGRVCARKQSRGRCSEAGAAALKGSREEIPAHLTPKGAPKPPES